MKRIFTLLFFIAFIISTSTAQQRYIDEVFENVTVTPDVEYGVNATVLFVPSVGEAVPQRLLMDIYELYLRVVVFLSRTKRDSL